MYKVIILQIKKYNCIEIILYSKQISFFKKIFIGFNIIIDLNNRKKLKSLENELKLKDLLKM